MKEEWLPSPFCREEGGGGKGEPLPNQAVRKEGGGRKKREFSLLLSLTGEKEKEKKRRGGKEIVWGEREFHREKRKKKKKIRWSSHSFPHFLHLLRGGKGVILQNLENHDSRKEGENVSLTSFSE